MNSELMQMYSTYGINAPNDSLNDSQNDDTPAPSPSPTAALTMDMNSEKVKAEEARVAGGLVSNFSDSNDASNVSFSPKEAEELEAEKAPSPTRTSQPKPKPKPKPNSSKQPSILSFTKLSPASFPAAKPKAAPLSPPSPALSDVSTAPPSATKPKQKYNTKALSKIPRHERFADHVKTTVDAVGRRVKYTETDSELDESDIDEDDDNEPSDTASRTSRQSSNFGKKGKNKYRGNKSANAKFKRKQGRPPVGAEWNYEEGVWADIRYIVANPTAHGWAPQWVQEEGLAERIVDPAIARMNLIKRNKADSEKIVFSDAVKAVHKARKLKHPRGKIPYMFVFDYMNEGEPVPITHVVFEPLKYGYHPDECEKFRESIRRAGITEYNATDPIHRKPNKTSKLQNLPGGMRWNYQTGNWEKDWMPKEKREKTQGVVLNTTTPKSGADLEAYKLDKLEKQKKNFPPNWRVDLCITKSGWNGNYRIKCPCLPKVQPPFSTKKSAIAHIAECKGEGDANILEHCLPRKRKFSANADQKYVKKIKADSNLRSKGNPWSDSDSDEEEKPKKKRGPGRPRKKKLDWEEDEDSDTEDAGGVLPASVKTKMAPSQSIRPVRDETPPETLDFQFCACCYSSKPPTGTATLIICEGCELAVHPDCYGLKAPIPEEWFCDSCSHGGTCSFCKKEGGAIKKYDSGMFHVECWKETNGLAASIDLNKCVVVDGSVKEKGVGPFNLFACSICAGTEGSLISCCAGKIVEVEGASLPIMMEGGECRRKFHASCLRSGGGIWCAGASGLSFCSKHAKILRNDKNNTVEALEKGDLKLKLDGVEHGVNAMGWGTSFRAIGAGKSPSKLKRVQKRKADATVGNLAERKAMKQGDEVDVEDGGEIEESEDLGGEEEKKSLDLGVHFSNKQMKLLKTMGVNPDDIKETPNSPSMMFSARGSTAPTAKIADVAEDAQPWISERIKSKKPPRENKNRFPKCPDKSELVRFQGRDGIWRYKRPMGKPRKGTTWNAVSGRYEWEVGSDAWKRAKRKWVRPHGKPPKSKRGLECLWDYANGEWVEPTPQEMKVHATLKNINNKMTNAGKTAEEVKRSKIRNSLRINHGVSRCYACDACLRDTNCGLCGWCTTYESYHGRKCCRERLCRHPIFDEREVGGGSDGEVESLESDGGISVDEDGAGGGGNSDSEEEEESEEESDVEEDGEGGEGMVVDEKKTQGELEADGGVEDMEVDGEGEDDGDDDFDLGGEDEGVGGGGGALSMARGMYEDDSDDNEEEDSDDEDDGPAWKAT
ncbi:hypothetical protein TrVE_jg11144 [Triparma verrucosa]|uniref:Uncharacterized protein n=1 Tax=Triparma verrucosa TaxID=1606542 RepID=A0A9W7F926_9STRA|nr:hypothetical protein TrVE_jg11144 [Triparma verrucosa]